jgi:DNA-binding NarL/FixJ family response regulator
MTKHILIMEDDALTRTAIASALSAQGYKVIAEASNVAQAIRSISNNQIDVAVLDLDVGLGPTGLDLADLLVRRLPQMGIVILTSSVDPRLVRASLPEIPASAIYVIKQDITDMNSLIAAIELASEKALTGRTNGSSKFLDQVPLTDVQMETLRLVAQGLTNSEIAKQRFVTEKAVEYTINKIAAALEIQPTSNANQRVHIARMYFRLRGQS